MNIRIPLRYDTAKEKLYSEIKLKNKKYLWLYAHFVTFLSIFA